MIPKRSEMVIDVGSDSAEFPRVSVLVPTLGREAKLARLLKLIRETAEYPNYEVLVLYDEFPPNNAGVIHLVAQGVAETTAPLIVYMGNDCLPQPGWLRIAVEDMQKRFPDLDGLIGFFDGAWLIGEMFCHFLVGRKLLPLLDGEVFCTLYRRLGVDNELTERARKLGKAHWCKKAIVLHDHPLTGPQGTDWSKWDEVYALAYNSEDQAHDIALLHERSRTVGFELRENFQRPTAEEEAAAEEE